MRRKYFVEVESTLGKNAENTVEVTANDLE
jgi:hypothetical protein